MARDFYLVLKLPRGATPEEIRSAYRRRARELHPDRSGAGSGPFIELQEAYSVLSDPALRATYDREVETIHVGRADKGTSARPVAEPFREVEPVEGFRDISLLKSFETFGPTFDEMFDRLWSNFDLLTRPKAETLESLAVDVPLSFEEALAGGSVRILVPTRAICPTCRGHGSVGFYECWQCGGQGALTADYPVQLRYPPGLRRDYVVRVPLDDLGIHNFYLTVRFRPIGTP